MSDIWLAAKFSCKRSLMSCHSTFATEGWYYYVIITDCYYWLEWYSNITFPLVCSSNINVMLSLTGSSFKTWILHLLKCHCHSISAVNKPWFHWCNDISSSSLDWIVSADDYMNQTTIHDDGDGPPRGNCPMIWGHHPFQRETFPCWLAEWKDVHMETCWIKKYYSGHDAQRSQITFI